MCVCVCIVVATIKRSRLPYLWPTICDDSDECLYRFMVEVHLIRINVRQFASERKGRTQLGAALRAVLSVRVHVDEVVQ